MRAGICTVTFTWWRTTGNNANSKADDRMRANTDSSESNRDPSSTEAKMAAFKDTGAEYLKRSMNGRNA